MLFEKTPLRRRLRLTILLTSLTALVLTFGAFAVYELIASRQDLGRRVEAMGEILAANSGHYLVSNRSQEAEDMLSSLSTAKHIRSAALFDRNGKLFARYPPSAAANVLPRPPADGQRFTATELVQASPVFEKDRRVGTLVLRSNLAPVYDRFRIYIPIGLLVMAGSLIAAIGLSDNLQKSILRPILELAQTARLVSERRDYGVRARKVTDDELGLLTDAFNHMLGQIHERESALRESAQRLSLALQASQTGTWDWDLQRNEFHWDDLISRQFGMPAGQRAVSFQQFIELIHRDDRQSVQHAVHEAVDGGQEFQAEFRVVWSDGSIHHLAARGNALRDERGKAVRLTGVSLDMTERHQAEETRSWLAALVESSDDAIVGKDLNGTIITWNSGAERMFGYTAEEVVGRPITILTSPDRPDEEEIILSRIRQGKPMAHYETVRMRKNGQPVHVSLSVSPIHDAKGSVVGVSSIARDITERKLAEEEIRRLNADLEQRVRERTVELTEANKELEAFTYSVSHDLRAPLRHIDAFARIIEDDLGAESSSELQRYVGRIRRGIQTMGRLVDDLLNLSRVGRAQLSYQDVDLNEVLEEALHDLRPEASKQPIEWRIGRLPRASCDPGLIKQVFTNLLSNSIKYSRPRQPAIIEVDQVLADGEPAIYVRDNGVGFNMKYINKLFGAFERLHRTEDFEGTGIGLALVRRIIQKHGGRVWAQGEPDKGATFYFTLPGFKTAVSP
jgi:PAS domain S-box-containing protein